MKLYLYDGVEKNLISTIYDLGGKVPSHQNRIFCLKSHPEHENVILSAGWDGAIKIYDLRAKSLVDQMIGPRCSGDSLDIFEDAIVCGNNCYKDTM